MAVSIPEAAGFLPAGTDVGVSATWADLTQLSGADGSPARPQQARPDLRPRHQAGLAGGALRDRPEHAPDARGAARRGPARRGGWHLQQGDPGHRGVAARPHAPRRLRRRAADVNYGANTLQHVGRVFDASFVGRSVIVGTQVAVVASASGDTVTLTENVDDQAGQRHRLQLPFAARRRHRHDVGPPAAEHAGPRRLPRPSGWARTPCDFRYLDDGGTPSVVLDVDWKRSYTTTAPLRLDIGGDRTIFSAEASGEGSVAVKGGVKVGLVVPLAAGRGARRPRRPSRCSRTPPSASPPPRSFTGSAAGTLGPLSISAGLPGGGAGTQVNLSADLSLDLAKSGASRRHPGQLLELPLRAWTSSFNAWNTPVDCGEAWPSSSWSAASSRSSDRRGRHPDLARQRGPAPTRHDRPRRPDHRLGQPARRPTTGIASASSCPTCRPPSPTPSRTSPRSARASTATSRRSSRRCASPRSTASCPSSARTSSRAPTRSTACAAEIKAKLGNVPASAERGPGLRQHQARGGHRRGRAQGREPHRQLRVQGQARADRRPTLVADPGDGRDDEVAVQDRGEPGHRRRHRALRPRDRHAPPSPPSAAATRSRYRGPRPPAPRHTRCCAARTARTSGSSRRWTAADADLHRQRQLGPGDAYAEKTPSRCCSPARPTASTGSTSPSRCTPGRSTPSRAASRARAASVTARKLPLDIGIPGLAIKAGEDDAITYGIGLQLHVKAGINTDEGFVIYTHDNWQGGKAAPGVRPRRALRHARDDEGAARLPRHRRHEEGHGAALRRRVLRRPEVDATRRRRPTSTLTIADISGGDVSSLFGIALSAKIKADWLVKAIGRLRAARRAGQLPPRTGRSPTRTSRTSASRPSRSRRSPSTPAASSRSLLGPVAQEGQVGHRAAPAGHRHALRADPGALRPQQDGRRRRRQPHHAGQDVQHAGRRTRSSTSSTRSRPSTTLLNNLPECAAAATACLIPIGSFTVSGEPGPRRRTPRRRAASSRAPRARSSRPRPAESETERQGRPQHQGRQGQGLRRRRRRPRATRTSPASASRSSTTRPRSSACSWAATSRSSSSTAGR